MTGNSAQETGFSLLELMVAVTIVALLALTALPAYSRYVQQGRISEAAALLAAHAATLEQRFLDTRDYRLNGGCNLPDGRFFTIECRLQDGGYRLTARNKAGIGLGAAGSYEYHLDSLGRQRTTRLAGASVDHDCWILKAGDRCP